MVSSKVAVNTDVFTDFSYGLLHILETIDTVSDAITVFITEVSNSLASAECVPESHISRVQQPLTGPLFVLSPVPPLTPVFKREVRAAIVTPCCRVVVEVASFVGDWVSHQSENEVRVTQI